MPKVKMAQYIGFFLCDQCASVHIGMWRNGEMFAEAIPDDIDALAAELAQAIEASRLMRGAAPTERKH